MRRMGRLVHNDGGRWRLAEAGEGIEAYAVNIEDRGYSRNGYLFTSRSHKINLILEYLEGPTYPPLFLPSPYPHRNYEHTNLLFHLHDLSVTCVAF